MPTNPDYREVIETTHDQLATEHGRNNVFITETEDGDVVSLVGEGVGDICFEEVSTHATPTGSNIGEGSVPDIEITEPVYPDLDADTARWVTCTLQWDPDKEVFVNTQADKDWEIVDNAFPDATYTIGNEDYGSLKEAMLAALGDTEWGGTEPTIIVDPEPEDEPEWGSTVS